MSQRIVNVDAAGILTEPISAIIRGTTYVLPGDVPAPLFARLIGVQESGGAGPAESGALYDELLSVFREHQPDLERLPIGLNEILGVVGYIYGSHDDEAPAGGGEDPTGRTRKPAARKRKPAAKRSRSST